VERRRQRQMCIRDSVQGNRMVDMQLSNSKLVDRGTLMVQEKLNISYEEAQNLLLKFGNVREAIIEGQKGSI
jgi:N-acetylmuramic acid 6-phosphate etherase